MDQNSISTTSDPVELVPPITERFATLLAKRGIDAQVLAARMPDVYANWLALFADSHPDSFLAQVRFQINNVRRFINALEH